MSCPKRVFFRKILVILCFLSSIAFFVQQKPVRQAKAAGSTYYISPSGNDSNPGTIINQPFKTIQKGLDTALQPGDTVMVRSGTYREEVEFRASGSASEGYITLQAYPGETPILSAPSGQHSDWHSVTIKDKSYIKVTRLTIANINYTSGGWQKSLTRGGIHVKAIDNSHIEIRDNHIYELRGPGSPSMNSYIAGIQVIGTSDNENGGLTNLVINNNLIHGVDVNNAEALQLKGNIKNWQVTNNEIYDVDNILLNIFGYDMSLTQQIRFQPRDGVIRGNHVHDSMAFGGCAGIYLDGGENIVVEENIVHGNFQGISINSETYNTPHHTAKNITVQNNLVYNNYMNGFSLGHMGDIVNILYRNNTVYQSGTAIMIGHAQQIKMVNNLFSIKTNENLTSGDRSKVQFDYNLYYASGANINPSGLGANSIFANPQLVAPGSGNFHLQSNSPAIDAGSINAGNYASTDFDGNPRPQGTKPDMGAFEYASGVQPSPSPSPSPSPQPNPYDLNDDGTVNVSDLLLILQNWGSETYSQGDFNSDGVVNAVDFIMLLGAWGS